MPDVSAECVAAIALDPAPVTVPKAQTDNPVLTERSDAALLYAMAHHRRQLRKGTEIPYASHLLAVTAIVLEMGGT